MTPSEKKFFFALICDAIRRGYGDQINATRADNKHVPRLRLLGYLDGDELTEIAFQRFFSTFELASCPSEIQLPADSFGAEIQWRRPRGVVKRKMDPAGGVR